MLPCAKQQRTILRNALSSSSLNEMKNACENFYSYITDYFGPGQLCDKSLFWPVRTKR
jgi:hypothetical protein